MTSESRVDADRPVTSDVPVEPTSFLRDLLLPVLTIIFVATMLYFRVHAFKFSIIDDSTALFENPYIDTPGAQDIGYIWRHSYYALYMPVTYTLWGLLARVDVLPHLTSVPPGGPNASYLNPAVFHIASLVLHAMTSVLCYIILRRLRFPVWPSLAGAMFFVVHPVQVQSVAWITGMNNLTGGFLGFLAIWLYLLQVRELDSTTSSGRKLRTIVFLTLATLAFAAALLAKPTATLTPLLVMVLEAFGLRRPARRWLPLMVFWSALSCVCAVLTWFTSKPVSSHIWSPLWGRPFIVGDSLAFYLTKVVLPVQLTLDYGRSPRQVLGHWWGYVTWILPAGMVLFAILWKRSGRRITNNRTYEWCVTGCALFVGGLLPVLGLVPFYTQRVSTVCDRYLYSALLGPAVIIAAVLAHIPNQKRSFPIVAAVLALLALQTSLLLPAWTDMNTQTNEMLEHNPESAMAHQNEGMILLEQNRMDLALPEFESSMRLDPEADNHAYFTGIALESLGRQQEAVAPLTRAFELDPLVPRNWYEVWNVLAFLKRYAEAADIVRKHLAVDPKDSFARFTLGKTLAADKKPGEALPYLLEAARQRPQEGAIRFFIGTVYEQVGDKRDALAAYQNADRLDPGHAQTQEAIARLMAH